MNSNTAIALILCVMIASFASCTVIANRSVVECSRLQVEAAKQASAPRLACEKIQTR